MTPFNFGFFCGFLLSTIIALNAIRPPFGWMLIRQRGVD